ncbi:MAG: type III pantothenate kinase [Bacteroidia bacterium]|jgi:type III pantothenate kinase
MNLIIDLGNTQCKVALYEGQTIVQSAVFTENYYAQIISKFPPSSYQNAILSSVIHHNPEIEELVKKCEFGLVLNSALNLPFINNYKTPETLGTDRLANAAALSTCFNGENAICIDIGTCIKFDFVDQYNSYHGGSIAPGMQMRYQALHTFTDKLPLNQLETNRSINESTLIGGNTNQSIESGVVNGMCAEINGMISRYQSEYADLKVMITGGDASFFETAVKKPIFADAFFTLHGLNAILNANAD